MISNYLNKITSILIQPQTGWIEIEVLVDVYPGLPPSPATAKILLQSDYVIEHGAGNPLVAALHFISSGLSNSGLDSTPLDDILFNLENTTIYEEIEKTDDTEF